MIVESLVAVFLVWNLRRILKATFPDHEWNRYLQYLMYVIVGLIVLEIIYPVEKVTKWLWYPGIFVMIGIIYFNPVFYAARNIMLAIIPFVLISFFSNLFELTLPVQYAGMRWPLEAANLFSIIWLIVMFIVSRNQVKALENERKKTQEEEEQKKILARKKEELEYVVAERTAELTRQKDELENTLVELKSTQTQLIQSEKMASLGELTAGIAHEIQNPLNFVNNFSEVNTELIAEMKGEIENGNLDEVMNILNDIEKNEQKINHHGKRADAIVKGMLQHSRTNSGKKEPTDINALADEYLRLSYHGLRARDKSFNANFTTDLDKSMGKIAVVPQDLGRVLLNLFNNAFFSVSEKKKQSNGAYEPAVSVSTRSVNDMISISVKDNGTGIPQQVVDKIFQPFFTTKPTGQGTGLGLSMSYDIIRAHGGELKVKTKEGEGAEFLIELPGK